MKKHIIAVAVIAMLIVAILISINFYNLSKERGESSYSDYYQLLAEQCAKKSSYNCCISSMNNMEQGNYKLMPESGCPEGYSLNMLKCIDSFKWCEPIQ